MNTYELGESSTVLPARILREQLIRRKESSMAKPTSTAGEKAYGGDDVSIIGKGWTSSTDSECRVIARRQPHPPPFVK